MTTFSPRLGYAEWAPGQTLPETTGNEIARYLEQGANIFAFKSRTTTAEPGSPTDGDCYLIPASPTGTHWSTQTGKIAFYENTAWVFLTAKAGWNATVANESYALITYNGSAWVAASGTPFASAAEVRAGSVSTKAIAPDVLQSSAAPQTLTDAAPTAWDMSLGYNAEWTLTGSHTLSTPTNPKQGVSYTLAAIQDATGSRVPTLPACFKFGSAGAPTFSTAANKRDYLFLYCYDAVTPAFRAVFNKDS